MKLCLWSDRQSRGVLPVTLGSEVWDHMRDGATVVRRGEVRGGRRRGTAWSTQLQCRHIIHLEHTPMHMHTRTQCSRGRQCFFECVCTCECVQYLWVYRRLYLFVQRAAGAGLCHTLGRDGCQCFWEIVFILVITGKNYSGRDRMTFMISCSLWAKCQFQRAPGIISLVQSSTRRCSSAGWGALPFSANPRWFVLTSWTVWPAASCGCCSGWPWAAASLVLGCGLAGGVFCLPSDWMQQSLGRSSDTWRQEYTSKYCRNTLVSGCRTKYWPVSEGLTRVPPSRRCWSFPLDIGRHTILTVSWNAKCDRRWRLHRR